MLQSRIPSLLAVAAAAALSACGSGDDAPAAVEAENEAEAPATNETNLTAVEPPAMIVRTTAYRCDDGNPLYVAELTNENEVNVRDTLQDYATRLTRESGEGPFTGDGRTLSNVGATVRYSSAERPEQECRAAEG